MFSFQGASESSCFQETQWSFLSSRNFSQSLWWRLAGSNRWPPACKAGALPAELNPRICLDIRYEILDIRYFENRCLIKDAVLAHPLSCILYLISYISRSWWAKMDSNHRPHDYQSCALASWAIGPYLVFSHFLGTFPSVPSKLNNEKILSILYWP